MEATASVFLAKLTIAEQSLTRCHPWRKKSKKIRGSGGGCVGKADVAEEGAAAISTVERWQIRTANEIITDSTFELLDLQKRGWTPDVNGGEVGGWARNLIDCRARSGDCLFAARIQ